MILLVEYIRYIQVINHHEKRAIKLSAKFEDFMARNDGFPFMRIGLNILTDFLIVRAIHVSVVRTFLETVQ